MTKIFSDTSTLYSPTQGKEKNLTILPLQVTINQQTYREFEEITSEQLLDEIQQKHIPSTSQPSIGEVIEAFEKEDDEILNLSMADGLSGTYQSCCMAKEQLERDNIYVINTQTLCGPHRYLVNLAAELASQGKNAKEIIDSLLPKIKSSISFLIPQDFEFLKRGGRCSKIAASLGGIMKLTIVMKQSDDGKQLEKHALARTYKKALSEICSHFKERGVNDEYLITISHATSQSQLDDTVRYLQNEFPQTAIEVYPLSPAFITQGGPGCLAIQCIKK